MNTEKVWFYGDEGFKPKKGNHFMSHDLLLPTTIGVVFVTNQEGRNKPRLPFQGSSQAAGWDVFNNLSAEVRLGPGERKLFPTGLRLMIPAGFEVQVRPRSGLALKKGVTVLNAPGTIDSDYTGELGVILINLSNEVKVITPNERIAQIVLKKVEKMAFKELASITKDTKRGDGGFGSTGE
jgi:dUTP pyrophosphatase